MNIRGKEKDIVNIHLGHESEGFATKWMTEHEDKKLDTSCIYESYCEGFYEGIRFLADYLNEYGIAIEIFDKQIKACNREDWYSGEVINK